MLKAKKDSTWHILDVYDEQAVNVNKQFTELENINQPVGSFSLSFRLPATPTNREFFGVFYDANAVDAINPKRRLEATVEVDTIPVLRGFIQLKGTYTKVNKYHEYEVVVFGELLNLREKADKQLSELDWSDLEHELSATNVVNSVSGTLLSGDIRYGCVERGQGMAAALNAGTIIYPASMTMFIRHKAIIDKVFEELGVEYSSDFFGTSEFAKYYTPLLNGGQYTTPLTPLSNPLWVAIDADETFTSPGIYTLDAWDESIPFYDTGNNFAPGTGIFTAPFSGNYQMKFYLNVEGTTATIFGADVPIHFVTLRLVDENNIVVWNSEVDDEESSGKYYGTPTGASYTVNVNVQLEDGIDYRWQLVAQAAFALEFDEVTVNAGTTLDLQDGTGFAILSAPQPFFDYNVSPAQQFPRMTIAQYLTGLQRCFNLLFIPDKLNPKKLTIEPFNDYMDDGVAVDWTDKLHIGKDKDDQLLPTTDIQRRKIEFTYSDDRDVVNEAYKDQDRTYGRFLIEDTENDFASGELKIQSTFSAFPLSSIGGKLAHYAVNDSGSPIESKMKMVYFGGSVSSQPINIFDGTSNIVGFPYFGHYSVPLPNSNNIDLNFGGEQPQHPILANPTDNLYFTYWRRWVVELFSDVSRKRVAYFKLSPLDIYNSQFNDRIWIVDSYWRITKMEADVNTEDLTKVELIKIIDVPAVCDLTPSSVVGGVVNFVDEAGDPATATESCCNAWGYLWTGSSCVQQSVAPQPQPQQAAPPVIGGVELQKLSAGVTTGFQVLTYQGDLTKNELLIDGKRFAIPYGASMALNLELLITEYDKVNGITGVEKQSFVGTIYAQYDDASPDVTIAITRSTRSGDFPAVSLVVTSVGNEIVFEVDDTPSNVVDSANVALRIDYVLARN